MEIRLAVENDIEDIAALWEGIDYYNREVLGLEGVFKDRDIGGKERYIKLLKQHLSDGGIVVLATLNGKKAGFVTCSVIDQFGNGVQDAVIDVSFVDESARGHGVGTEMYTFLESHLKSLGVIGITTEVFEVNTGSLNFHKKVGYRIIAKSIEVYKKI